MKTTKATIWAGRVLSALVVALLLFSAAMKLSRSPEVIKASTEQLGLPEATIVPIGVLEVACALLYALPWTSVLGAVLLTGYFGGATLTHLRVGDPFLPPVVIGLVAWLGLYLREPRLHALLPIRKPPATPPI